MNDRPASHEETIIKRQWIAVAAAFVFFLVGGFISMRVFGVTKYGVLGVCLPMLYIGASSIKNRISIVRVRGRQGYSRDKHAVTFGVILLVLAIAYLVLAFMP